MKRNNKLFTHLGIALLMGSLLVSCGKDNKSGKANNTQWGINGLGVPGQYGQIGNVSNQIVLAAMNENPCKNGQQGINQGYYPNNYQVNPSFNTQRFGIQTTVSLTPLPVNAIYLGVTSYGDVGVIAGQGMGTPPLFVGYICPRTMMNGGTGNILPGPKVQSLSPYCGGAISPIVAADMSLPDGSLLKFRWADGGAFPDPSSLNSRVKFSFCQGYVP